MKSGPIFIEKSPNYLSLNNVKPFPRNLKKLELQDNTGKVKLILKDTKIALEPETIKDSRKINQVTSKKKLDIPLKNSQGTFE